MQIQVTEEEAEALILIKRMLINASTPVPLFLHWIAERLIIVHKETREVDYIQTIYERASQLDAIAERLKVRRYV